MSDGASHPPAGDARPVVAVTGAGRGIGRAIALLLAESGYDLVLNDLDPATLAETAAAAQAAGGAVECAPGDITADNCAERVVAAAVARFGRIDALVNNAGKGLTAPFAEISQPDWEGLFALHLHAAARLSRLAYRELAASPGAAIVNVSSVAAALSLPHRVAYTSAKAAVEGFTRSLAAEWARDGIRVNAVAPGTIVTPLVAENFAKGLLDKDKVLERTPLGRLGEAREVATAVRFLISPESSYITGQTLRVDGGWSIWGGW
jgi:NAD(P)-dependent dehydrogenase (short-subunit alcohol dehydrogenase family)